MRKIWLMALFLGCSVALLTGKELNRPLAQAGENHGEISNFVKEAKLRHGDLGHRAARFLVEGMPQADLKALSGEFLLENLKLALEAREKFPWAKAIPEEVFFNDVLPYASLDETRENWRGEFLGMCSELVKACQTTEEAAQVLNREIFNQIKVHYNTGRKRPNQSPSESRDLGMATCTGLSIILVDACRSVGVPARIAGTARWSKKRGNHTWVEIYVDGEWHFTGADEYDAKGLDRGWFTIDAGNAQADSREHAIWATSWKKTGATFPMVWNFRSESVPAVNVTSRYVKKDVDEGKSGWEVFVRLWDKKGGKRLVAELRLGEQVVSTRGGTADLNDMATLKAAAGDRMKVKFQGKTHEVVLPVGKTVDLYLNELK